MALQVPMSKLRLSAADNLPGLLKELNLEPSVVSGAFDERRYGPASEIVPAFVEELLAGRG